MLIEDGESGRLDGNGIWDMWDDHRNWGVDLCVGHSLFLFFLLCVYATTMACLISEHLSILGWQDGLLVVGGDWFGGDFRSGGSYTAIGWEE